MQLQPCCKGSHSIVPAYATSMRMLEMTMSVPPCDLISGTRPGMRAASAAICTAKPAPPWSADTVGARRAGRNLRTRSSTSLFSTLKVTIRRLRASNTDFSSKPSYNGEYRTRATVACTCLAGLHTIIPRRHATNIPARFERAWPGFPKLSSMHTGESSRVATCQTPPGCWPSVWILLPHCRR